VRGRILKDTNSGPGIVTIEGVQHPFTLANVWKSDIAPTSNMVVEVEMHDGVIASMTAVPDSQLAKEQANVAVDYAKKTGLAFASAAVNKFGFPFIAAMALIAISCLYLDVMTVQLTETYSVQMSFWQVMKLLNGGTKIASYVQPSTAGVYGVIFWAALALPFLPYVWKNPKGELGAAAPLLLIMLTVFLIYIGIRDHAMATASAAREVSTLFGGSRNLGVDADIQARITESLINAIHARSGFYVALISSGYLAFKGVINYLAKKA